MAQKRMFDKTVVKRDDFIEMPDSSQNLYFHLSMEADDDGFVDNWKSIMRMTGKKEDDLKILISKQFIIPFQSGVIVIRHWRINNILRSDRYHETKYLKEKSMLKLEENQEYNFGIPDVYQLDTIGNRNIEENSIEENNICVDVEHKCSTHSPIIDDIVYYLNNCGVEEDSIVNKRKFNFKNNSKTLLKLVNALLKQKYELNDFKDSIYQAYINYVENEWKTREGNSSIIYYTPETVFKIDKFEKHLNQYRVENN